MKIVCVVGARPNFMKIAPIIEEFKKNNINPLLVHTGQHYDKIMSDIFFEELGIPKPDINLGVGSGSHAQQTAKIMELFEPILDKEKPDFVLVVGDVNSTLACSLVASKMGIKIVHIEAGLRSFNWSMPEEINRVVTDRLSDFLFTTEKDANDNLKKEGIDESKVFFVGNVMVDTLLRHREKASQSKILDKFNLKEKEYCVLTLHRPSNVDNKNNLSSLLEVLKNVNCNIIFPAHPRTLSKIKEFSLELGKNIKVCEPLGYLDFLNLVDESKFIMTDSGGIQEETTVLGVPCLTLREETERPVTIIQGTNVLIGNDKNKLKHEIEMILKGKFKKGTIPEFWDGMSSKRIVEVILNK